MANPSQTTNPLDYPRYVRGIRPTMPESLGQYVDDELEKLQNSFDNMAVAADSSAAARVTEEAIVRADADSALAASVTTVSTRVDDNESSIEFLLSSENGDEATARLTVDVNGKVTGFKINGAESEFIVDASRFAVGEDGEYVFEVSGGTTYIKNAVIQNQAIDANKLSEDVINKVVSASATGVTATDAGNLMVTLAGLPVKVSQGGYVHLILSANISGNPGALSFGVSRLYGWLQRRPAGSGTWTTIHSWPMYANGVVEYDDDGVLESAGHTIGVSATTQYIDTPPADGSYDYRWMAGKDLPGSVAPASVSGATATNIYGMALSTKVG
ncbi:hypothetical protein BSL82_03720 [Tardibacter chloracetimidivorans]|uniref:Tip attachment protein J central straight fiber domain-containing protein n=1 Tax=Tardibacter chloracetimidivorans TaxID=1921510 RepID=A0A1L3ZSC8_9SPHN|nr:hypothetical protein [Tardibacter chloracetimidivorans]API58525.1 hypothetical protein BSL82_03720 [Tardibacter chloracetimidivorans]